MSIQDMTRFVGILSLDPRKLAKFMKVVEDGKDINEDSRMKMIEDFYPAFDVDLEVPVLASGDMSTIFQYIYDTAPRPIPDIDIGG